MENEKVVVTKKDKPKQPADCASSVSQLTLDSATKTELEAMKLAKRDENRPQPLGPGLGCVR